MSVISDQIAVEANAFTMRSLISEGINEASKDASDAVTTAGQAVDTANNANAQVAVIIKDQDGKTPVEVVASHHSNITQKDFISSGARMDDHDSQLAETAKQSDLVISNKNITANTDAIENNTALINTNITQIASVASGSPTPYATLALLQADTGASKLKNYVVTADGYVYYWNGSAWTKGWVYQSTAIGNGGVALENLNPAIISDFIGTLVSASKLNTAEVSMAYQLSFDITGKTVIGAPLQAMLDFFTQSSNVKDYDVIFWSTDTLAIGNTPTRLGQSVPVINGIQHYNTTKTSISNYNGKYLHVMIWVQHNANIATDWYFRNFNVYLNGIQLLNPVISQLFIAEGVAITKNTTYLPTTSATRDYVVKSFANYVPPIAVPFKPYQSGQIFFTVPVNQNFADNVDTANIVQDSESFNNVPCVLMLPANYSPTGNPVTLVMRAHGAGGTVTGTDGGEISYAQDLVNAGYAVFDVNGASDTLNQHMGSPRAIQAYKKAYAYIKANYNIEKRIFVHGGSMGCLAAMNFTIANPGLVKAVAIFSGVTDLYNQAWLNPWLGSTKQAIAINYNFTDQTGNTWEADKIVGYNPINNNAADINSQHYVFFPIPLKFWHGTADTVVSPINSQALITAIKNAGGKAYLRMVIDQPHSMATGTTVVNQEEIMWFNRFQD